MPSLPTNFGLLPAEDSAYETSRVAILPVPFERTTSYGKGTGEGPAAIIRASQAMELWDEELQLEPSAQGITTVAPFLPHAFDMAAALDELRTEARRHMAAGKFVVTLGGEHSLTWAPVMAARDAFGAAGPVGVVQFDAHADLRDEFEGTPWSHACVMGRIVDQGFPTLAVGIRSLSTPEATRARQENLPVIWGHELPAPDLHQRFVDALKGLPEQIYLTFDIDYFDPSLVPATGTPEPGGGTWYPTLALLKTLFETKKVVAMDLVELAPTANHQASDFLAAKLIYKCLGWLQARESR